ITRVKAGAVSGADKEDRKILDALLDETGEKHEVVKIPGPFKRREARALGDAFIKHGGGSEKYGGRVKNQRHFIPLDDPDREQLMKEAQDEVARYARELKLGDPVPEPERSVEVRTRNKYINEKRNTGRPVGRPRGSGKGGPRKVKPDKPAGPNAEKKSSGVYVLKNDSNEVRYVGSGILKNRMRAHKKSPERKHLRFVAVIPDGSGSMPTLVDEDHDERLEKGLTKTQAKFTENLLVRHFGEPQQRGGGSLLNEIWPVAPEKYGSDKYSDPANLHPSMWAAKKALRKLVPKRYRKSKKKKVDAFRAISKHGKLLLEDSEDSQSGHLSENDLAEDSAEE
ncbi:MAG: GIY-YIG nuclease family protein, partial [Acidobacteriota bacterium]